MRQASARNDSSGSAVGILVKVPEGPAVWQPTPTNPPCPTFGPPRRPLYPPIAPRLRLTPISALVFVRPTPSPSRGAVLTGGPRPNDLASPASLRTPPRRQIRNSWSTRPPRRRAGTRRLRHHQVEHRQSRCVRLPHAGHHAGCHRAEPPPGRS